MRDDNVHLLHYKHGELVEERHGHNTWTETGHVYLAHIMSLASMGPDVPERIERLAAVGFGIGGYKQHAIEVDVPPLSSSYPAGADPRGTTGKQYNDKYPLTPLIETLERPVRISGGTLAYPGAPADRWLYDHAFGFFAYTRVGSSIRITTVVVAPHFNYGPFIMTPLSEVGLFLDTASPIGDPYVISPPTLVAYHAFDTIFFDGSSILLVTWTVSF